MAAKAKEYEFPMLTEKDILTELAEILPPHSASQLSANDLKKPTAVKWQKFYVDILCVVFDLRVIGDVNGVCVSVDSRISSAKLLMFDI